MECLHIFFFTVLAEMFSLVKLLIWYPVKPVFCSSHYTAPWANQPVGRKCTSLLLLVDTVINCWVSTSVLSVLEENQLSSNSVQTEKFTSNKLF